MNLHPHSHQLFLWNFKVYIRGVHWSLSIDEKSWGSSLKQRGLFPSPRQRSAKEMVKIGEWRKLLHATRHHHQQQDKSCQPRGAVRRAERTPLGLLAFTVSTPGLAMAWESLGMTEWNLSLQASSVTTDIPKDRCLRSRRTGVTSGQKTAVELGSKETASKIGRTLPGLRREWQLSSTERDTFWYSAPKPCCIKECSHSGSFCRWW